MTMRGGSLPGAPKKRSTIKCKYCTARKSRSEFSLRGPASHVCDECSQAVRERQEKRFAATKEITGKGGKACIKCKVVRAAVDFDRNGSPDHRTCNKCAAAIRANQSAKRGMRVDRFGRVYRTCSQCKREDYLEKFRLGAGYSNRCQDCRDIDALCAAWDTERKRILAALNMPLIRYIDSDTCGNGEAYAVRKLEGLQAHLVSTGHEFEGITASSAAWLGIDTPILVECRL